MDGEIVLDIGAQMMQVANQTRIFGLVPSARSRLNTVYMTVYFLGAAAGSALSTVSLMLLVKAALGPVVLSASIDAWEVPSCTRYQC